MVEPNHSKPETGPSKWDTSPLIAVYVVMAFLIVVLASALVMCVWGAS